MINNDILRRLRYALSINNDKMLEIFKHANVEMPHYHLANILRKEDEESFVLCQNDVLVAFLDGLIIEKRGKQEGREPVPFPKKTELSNNEILRKIKIAMMWKDTDILEMLKLADFEVSKSELSALFRKKDHRNYQECGDQFLRNVLMGMTKKYRPASK